MAVLNQPVSNVNVFAEQIGTDLAPAGTYVATIIDIRDEFGVMRQKFQSTEMEKVDQTTFLFGYRDQVGHPHKVASRRMKISGNDKSTLFTFLKSLLGRAPQYGWDYAELKGKQCLLTVEHVQKRDGSGVFAAIAALSPVPLGFSGQVPVASVQSQAPVQRPVVIAPVAPAPVATQMVASLPPAGFPPFDTAQGRPVAAAPQSVPLPTFHGSDDEVPF